MTTEPIVESGMTFGPFPDGMCFHIERSRLYTSVKKHVSTVEFLLLRLYAKKPPVVWMVEAKQSSPNPNNPQQYEQFIGEITDKFTHTLALSIAGCLGRHPGSNVDLPEHFRNLQLAHVGFRCVLVMRGYPESWLAPLSDALRKELRPLIKVWALQEPVVLNEEQARRHQLILSPPEMPSL